MSAGCQHCYAETFSKRTGNDLWGKDGERRFFPDKHWGEPIKWNKSAGIEGRRHRVFCASMADVFEDRPDLIEHRARLFDLIVATPNLDWQLLTKRPENVRGMVPPHWLGPDAAGAPCWPDNCWLGTTVEEQDRADERVPVLLALPAPVRFLSCEPLLAPVSLRRWLADKGHDGFAYECQVHGLAECEQTLECSGVQWVIVGGESGPGHRALNLDWARNLRDECTMAQVPFFFKQVGGRTPTAGGDVLDGKVQKEFPCSRT